MQPEIGLTDQETVAVFALFMVASLALPGMSGFASEIMVAAIAQQLLQLPQIPKYRLRPNCQELLQPSC